MSLVLYANRISVLQSYAFGIKWLFIGAVSSAVRALASHARGHWFKSSTAHAEVAEWQTRYVQGVVSARMCEFKSHLRHQAPVAQWIRAQPCGG